ncbi:histone H1A, sperm-like [Aphis gossypii]|uniref:histone H1A, sperm-like n=1 Tax=Aphis gossypii TaxID=80765 RepID=UPI00100F37A3|nr:histone H1A, sperm-like [Aphis gossypii]
MTDNVVVSAPAPVTASPAAKKSPAKKKVGAAAKAKKPAANHPTTSVMVTSAIKELKEKKGSSLPAIKKYLAANYKVDPAKLAPFIRKFLKAAVANGTVLQTKGTGASGHFKLPVAEVKPKKKTAVVKKKKAVVKKVKAPGATKRKSTSAKKVKPASGEPAAKKVKKAVAAKPKAASKPKKSPAKPKKPVAAKPKVKKTPTKKTAAPKKK